MTENETAMTDGAGNSAAVVQTGLFTNRRFPKRVQARMVVPEEAREFPLGL